MNFKTTLVLLVLLIAAGGYVAYDHYKSADAPEKGTVAANPDRLFDVADPKDVTSVAIRGADTEIVLTAVPEPDKKDKKPDDPFAAPPAGPQWRMSKPVESAANSTEVNDLVRELTNLETQAKVDPAGKGLDKPKYTVELAAKGGKILKFAVGDRNQIGQMYVRVEGKPKADVVSASVYDRLVKPANDLRDKKLVAAKTTDINQLKIETEGQTLLLQKKGADWQLVEPKQFAADASVMTDLLGAVTNLQATDWIAKDSPDVSKARFDKPRMTVWFSTTPTPPATQPAATQAVAATQPVWTQIAFGQYEDATKEKIYARTSDTQAVVKVQATAFDTLTKKPVDVRDRKALDITPEQVSKLSIQTDLPGGPAPAAHPTPAKKTLVNIERRKQLADAVPATKPAGTSQPAATQPAKPPAAPGSTWALLSDPKGDADDEAIKNLLADLHPLTVTKYLDAAPTTQPTATYTLSLTTEAPGGAQVTQHQLTLTDPGGEKNLLGTYNGLAFELGRTILPRLEGNFAKKKPDPAIPAPGGALPGLPGAAGPDVKPDGVFNLEPSRK